MTAAYQARSLKWAKVQRRAASRFARIAATELEAAAAGFARLTQAIAETGGPSATVEELRATQRLLAQSELPPLLVSLLRQLRFTEAQIQAYRSQLTSASITTGFPQALVDQRLLASMRADAKALRAFAARQR